MSWDTSMPTITFGEECGYEMLDSILNGRHHSASGYGWGVRVWVRQGVVITARWGGTSVDGEVCSTSLLAWSNVAQDYVTAIEVPTYDIYKIEVL